MQLFFVEKPKFKISVLKIIRIKYLVHTFSDKAFKDIVVSGALACLHKGSFEFTLTVPLFKRKKR